MTSKSKMKAKDHPLSRGLAALLEANVAYARTIMQYTGNERFKRQLLLRLIGGAAHFQSFCALLAQAEGITEKEIIEATEIGEKLMDDAVKLAQDRTQNQMGLVHARPRKASPGGAPAPLVELLEIHHPTGEPPKGS